MITNVKPSQPAAQDVCVVYCRVSSTEQAAVDRASLDAQERRLLPLAKELGLPILYVKKHAESASILDKRSEFQQVLADAKAQKFQVLLVDRMNRFSRSEDLSEYMQVMTRLKEAGVRVVFAEKQYDNTPTGQLQAFVDAYASAVEQANRRKQSRDGKHGRVHTHKHPLPGHKPPYGYRWVQTPDGQVKKTNLEKTADQTQETVERIWRYFLQDEEPTMRGMAMRLNRAHVPPPRRAHGVAGAGDRWYASSIQAILHNGVYWGEPTTFAKSK